MNLILYEKARKALSAVVSIDEVKQIMDKTAAPQDYARRAKDPKMMADGSPTALVGSPLPASRQRRLARAKLLKRQGARAKPSPSSTRRCNHASPTPQLW
jgi:hypothetical protein